AAQQLLGERGLKERPAAGERADRTQQCLDRDVLPEIAPGTAAKPREQDVAVVERGEQQARRRLGPRLESLQYLDPGAPRHPDVEQADVDAVAQASERLVAIAGLGH